MLAPAALLVFAVAVALVVLDSGGSEEGGADETTTAGQRTTTTNRPAGARRPRGRATYTVRPGDTLGGIGEKTKVGVERLQELNPSLDPQALVSGQKIKLRE
jgi:LysM repeat protein